MKKIQKSAAKIFWEKKLLRKICEQNCEKMLEIIDFARFRKIKK